MRDSYLAIVTARAGSKRLPGKNIRKFASRPLFVWSVLAALNCPQISRTIVSTDSDIYQRIAISAGADCPWLRDLSLASDDASSADVVKDVLDKLGAETKRYRGLVLLQPTSPLRTAEDITNALALYEARNAPAVVSVSEAECPPAWMLKLSADHVFNEFASEGFCGQCSQSLGNWYRLNGAIYVIGINDFYLEHDFKPHGTLAYVMPRARSIDVDTIFDFKLAELLFLDNIKSSQGKSL